jgi:HK97 gp10 family phage protein
VTYTWKLDTKELDKLAAGLDKNRADVLKAIGFEVESGAKQRAPVRTGALRNSIATEMQGDDAVRIGPGVEYGVFLELGTSRGLTARPYLFPAVDEVVNAINSGKFWERLFKR